MSSASSRSLAAAMFSSRCGTEPVPGIGSMTGALCKSHARVTCDGVAPSFFATAFTFALRSDAPAASGYQGRKAMPRRSHAQYILGAAVAEVVAVLNRDDGHDLARLLELVHRHVGQADVP